MHRNDPPSDPRDLLSRAKSGDGHARQHLLGWAYGTARSYYERKSRLESTLSVHDAHDLAGAFCLEFERAWPRIDVVVNYTRRMLKNNLRRHLQRARLHRHREQLHAPDDLLARYGGRLRATMPASAPDWNDAQWRQYRTAIRVLEKADPRTRELMRYRFGSKERSYREIAACMGTSESALRMRMARFYAAVRRDHERSLPTQRNEDNR